MKVYVQPVVRYGVLVYGTSNKTLILPLDSKKKLQELFLLSLNQPPLAWNENQITFTRLESCNFFELLKKLAEILRAECQIDCLKNVITR